MDFNILTLSHAYLQEHVDDFIHMLNDNLNDEYWNAEHFLSDLNKKWIYSSYATVPSGTLTGFLIASEKETSVHIHKFVVDQPYHGKGLGGKMLDHLKNQTNKPITLKVNRDNQQAWTFYSRKGFTLVEQKGNQCTMILSHE